MPQCTAVIVQPCFLPWRGQFDLFSRGDVRILLDNVQFVRRSWYNRNKIIDQGEIKWLTVPVQMKGNYHSLIQDIRIDNQQDWQKKLCGTIQRTYKRFPFYDEYGGELLNRLQQDWEFLVDLNRSCLDWCLEIMGLGWSFRRASEFTIHSGERIERLMELCRAVGANRYVSGPTARAYIGGGECFAAQGLELDWMDYPHYPEYPRPDGTMPSEELSVIDLIFSVGPDAPRYIFGHHGGTK